MLSLGLHLEVLSLLSFLTRVVILSFESCRYLRKKENLYCNRAYLRDLNVKDLRLFLKERQPLSWSCPPDFDKVLV